MKRVAVLSVVLALVAAMSIQAQEPQRQGRQRGEARQAGQARQGAFNPVDMLRRQIERLDLTAEQKQKIDKLVADRREKLTELAQKARLTDEQREAQRAALAKAREDGVAREQMRDVIAKAVQRTPEQQKAQEELTKETVALRAAIGELLTPEQRERLQRARERRPGGEGRPGGQDRPRGQRRNPQA